MKFFDTNTNSPYTIIIGCGILGANIANTLSNAGENVLIMDERKESFQLLSSNFGGLSIIGNGLDLDKLQEAHIERATGLIAVTDDDNTNIMIALLAKELFHVKQVVAKLYDMDREIVYKNYDINTICPTVLSANEINKILAGAPAKGVLA